jgi:acetylornithine/succinyldiaminopimelate/putrescine aminotransferase
MAEQPAATSNQQIVARGASVLIGNYARQPINMAGGQGSLLWDSDGKRYLDLFAGFGGSILGHCHPALIAAAHEQAQKLWHVGNTFYTEPQIEFAERLNRHAFRGQAFFCHSGAEANEAACKLARLRGSQNGGKRWKIVSLLKSFHGRTLAMIAATGNPQYRAGFGPDVPGFVNIPLGDFDALAAAVDDQTAGILMEPIQGEGGINLHPPEYPQRVRELCDRHGLTLIFDEVWTGGGRTGKWFAHQHFCRKGSGFRVQGSERSSPEPRTLNPEPSVIEPDIMTLGKAVGGGLPVGVMFAKPELAKLLVPSTHGCTLGGNPICMAVARTIFDVIEREKLVEHAAELGELAIGRLRNEPKIKDKITDVRGRGLMLGVQLKNPPEKFLDKALARGLVVNLTAKQVVRLAPAINIPREQWNEGLGAVIDLIASL